MKIIFILIGLNYFFMNSTPSISNRFYINPAYSTPTADGTLYIQNPAPVQVAIPTPTPLAEPRHAKHHPEAQAPKKETHRLKSFGLASGLFLGAFMLRRIPTIESAYKLIPTDWKQWAKIGLGITGINQLNQGLQWKPPLWLGALQTVLILNPLLLAKFGKDEIRQLAVLAPFIATLVQASHWTSDKVGNFLERTCNIPPMLTQIAFSVITTLFGIKSFPLINEKAEGAYSALSNRFKPNTASAQNKPLPDNTKPPKETEGQAMAATVGGCACCNSIVCLNELTGYAGGVLQGWKHKKQTEVKTP